MTDPMLKLQILARAELALVQIRVQRLLRRSALLAAALVFALLGLGMFNLAAFYALSPALGPAVAAAILALVDCVIVAVILVVALKTIPHQAEEKLACEIRDLAMTELNRDIDEVKAEISQITDDVRSIRTGIMAVPTAAVNTLFPALRLLTKAVKK
jgi:fatty acid desaturase